MYYITGLRRKRQDKVLDSLIWDISSDAWSDVTVPCPESSYYTYEPFRLTLDSDQLAEPVMSITDAHSRLQLLSRCLVKPNTINLTGLFDALPLLVWTTAGPILPDDHTSRLFSAGTVSVTHIDKFPYLVNYYIPPKVRIASGSQVRLGAYLSPGTVVMPAGFVNFNAGSLGPCMIEGRVSAGVTLGANTDIGGGASIMGTLSGGNTHVISVGASCLVGANAGLGISLGDNCIIEAGLYITAGKKVYFEGEWVKASVVSGQSNLRFIQHSQTGEIHCTRIQQHRDILNPLLHNVSDD